MTDKEATEMLTIDGEFTSSRTRDSYLKHHHDLLEYMTNRYDDIPEDNSNHFFEIGWRIVNGLEHRPVCELCGKPVRYLGNGVYRHHCSFKCSTNDPKIQAKKKATNLERYGGTAPIHSPKVKAKIQTTNIERYGVANPYANESVKAHIRQTHLEKYGVEHAVSSPEVKAKKIASLEKKYGKGIKSPGSVKEVQDKMRKTCLERYGYEYATKNPEIQAKITATCIEKYGGPRGTSSDEVKEKVRQTNRERYGVDYYTQTPEARKHLSDVLRTPEIRAKVVASRISNGTFGYFTSAPESLMKDLLEDIFGKSNVLHQYTSEEYPFYSDFYIKTLDLYIEYHGDIRHHGKPFSGSPNDLAELEELKKKEDDGFVNSIIDTWTNRDLMKIKKAIDNNLNMLIIYPKWSLHWNEVANRRRDGYEIPGQYEKIKESLCTLIEKYQSNEEHLMIVGTSEDQFYTKS